MGLWEGVLSAEAGGGSVRPTRTRIRLLTQPESMRSIIDATQRERQHGLA